MSFTRIPNNIIDNLRLDPYQFQILSIIIRKTDGWCKVEDGISLSQFQIFVSFKKNKIINTIKSLENLGLIVKTKQQKQDGGNSFNLYKVSQTLVSENNKGSISQVQPLVSENNKQKKAITKETNTIKEKDIKENPTVKKSLTVQKNDLLEAHPLKESVKEFIEHRRELKKPMTNLALTKFINKIDTFTDRGFNVQECMNNSIAAGYSTIYEPKIKKAYVTKADKNKEAIRDSVTRLFNNKTTDIDKCFREQNQALELSNNSMNEEYFDND